MKQPPRLKFNSFYNLGVLWEASASLFCIIFVCGRAALGMTGEGMLQEVWRGIRFLKSILLRFTTLVLPGRLPFLLS
jgi:hypothetical protein